MGVMSPPLLKPSLGKEIPGKVYHMDFNSGVVWFMPDFLLPGLEEIANTLDTFQSEVDTRSVAVGQLYVVRSSSSRRFCRAEVTEVRDKNSVSIRLIDYGTSELRSREELFVIPEEISRIPPSVLRLRPSGDFGRRQVEYLVLGRQVTAVVRMESRGAGPVEELAHFYEDGKELLFERNQENIEVNEVLREAPVSMPDLVIRREELERERENRIEDSSVSRSPPRSPLELIMTRPKLTPKAKPAVPEDVLVFRPKLLAKKEQPKGRKPVKSWAIGEQVSAFWCGDNTWKKGVIHELDSSSALVVFTEEDVRPTFIDLSLIKPGSVPPSVLNQLELEVSDISRNLQLNLDTGEEHREQEKIVSVTMSPGQVLDSTAEDFCKFARTGAGSRVLQSYVSPSNRKLCQRMVEHLLSSDIGVVRMMTNARSCFLLQKIFEHLFIIPEDLRNQLIAAVLENFSFLSLDRFGYHVVLVAVTKLGGKTSDEYARMFENKSLLHRLLKDPRGTFVAQTCVASLPSSTVNFIVNSVLGHTVELSNHKYASFFIQRFLKHWGQSSSLDLVVEDILRHQRELIHNPQGVRTIQTLLQIRADPETASTVTEWIIRNIEPVYKDQTAVFAAKQLISTITGKIQFSEESSWVLLLDKLVYQLMVGSNSAGRNHFISAACSSSGNPLMMKILRVSQHLTRNIRAKLQELISSYRTILAADSIGSSVLKAVKNLA